MDLKLRNRTQEATVDGEGEDADRTRKDGAVVINSNGQMLAVTRREQVEAR